MSQHRVWRVGFQPQPWEWTDWRWAGADGRFNGRWDPLDGGLYRTVYAGESLLACFVELMAQFRPDELLRSEMDDIIENDTDADEQDVPTTGILDIRQWARERVAAEATIRGSFIDVTSFETVQLLRPKFQSRALAYGLKEFDAAALKSSEHRPLTQEVSQYLWTAKRKDGSDYCDGIMFRSRHGDDLVLWAVFERDSDGIISRLVSDITIQSITEDDAVLRQALAILGIQAMQQ